MRQLLKKILDAYNNFMIMLLRIKFICVNQPKFMKRQEAMSGGNLSASFIKKRCKRLAFICTFTTVFITFLSTLPTQVYISIPLAVIDFLQFQVFLYIIQQQIMYLFGSKDLRGSDGKIDYKNGSYIMWLETNVMLGTNDSLKSKLKSVGGFVVRKSITLIFTKSPFRLIMITGMRQFLKWFGVLVTHEIVLSSLDVLVSILCAIIAAGVSLWQFYPMVKRFFKKLEANGLEVYEDAYYNGLDSVEIPNTDNK